MADEKLDIPTTLVHETCITCGIRFALPDYYQQRRKHDHANYSCPNGHNQHWLGVNDTDLKKKYQQALEEIAKLEVGAIFNKDTLQLAIKTAQLALK